MSCLQDALPSCNSLSRSGVLHSASPQLCASESARSQAEFEGVRHLRAEHSHEDQRSSVGLPYNSDAPLRYGKAASTSVLQSRRHSASPSASDIVMDRRRSYAPGSASVSSMQPLHSARSNASDYSFQEHPSDLQHLGRALLEHVGSAELVFARLREAQDDQGGLDEVRFKEVLMTRVGDREGLNEQDAATLWESISPRGAKRTSVESLCMVLASILSDPVSESLQGGLIRGSPEKRRFIAQGSVTQKAKEFEREVQRQRLEKEARARADVGAGGSLSARTRLVCGDRVAALRQSPLAVGRGSPGWHSARR